MSQLIVNNLSLGYDGIVVSEGINFQVNKGDYLCIVGENGSGKSTLMKTLLGLQKPLSGEVVLSDGAVAHPNRLSAAADTGAEGFSRIRAGNLSCRDFWRRWALDRFTRARRNRLRLTI